MPSDAPQPLEIECLACGRRRVVTGTSRDELGACPACGYVGWAASSSLSERDRRALHGSLGAEPRPAKRKPGYGRS